jgi:predicted GIY-YIG superfamily endonuclease
VLRSSNARGKAVAKAWQPREGNMGKFHYVYVLQSLVEPARHYTGFTEALSDRLQYHNAGRVPHTSKFMPWRIQNAFAFCDRTRALAFERYLKSPSGRAFSRKHF